MTTPPSPRNPHHLTTRQIVAAFAIMVVAVVLGYLIIDWSNRREQRKRQGPSMWDSPTPGRR